MAIIILEIEQHLYPSIGGVIRDLRCTLLTVNGMPDHIHLLVRYRADLSHSDLLRHVKARSSKWINETFPQFGYFSWQEGYGGFTISASNVPAVQDYIARQKEHHLRQDFQSEFLELLGRHGFQYVEADVFK